MRVALAGDLGVTKRSSSTSHTAAFMCAHQTITSLDSVGTYRNIEGIDKSPNMADVDSVPITIDLKLPQYAFQLQEESLSHLHEEARKGLWEGIEKYGESNSTLIMLSVIALLNDFPHPRY